MFNNPESLKIINLLTLSSLVLSFEYIPSYPSIVEDYFSSYMFNNLIKPKISKNY